MKYSIILSFPFIIYYSSLLLSNYIVPHFKRKSLIEEMSKRSDWPAIERKQNTLKKLFKNDYAKISSKIYRNLQLNTNNDFLYGEIDFLSFYKILEKVEPRPQEVFCDLGSGAGKAVFSAALFFDFIKSYGIELVPPLYKKANKKLKKIKGLLKDEDAHLEQIDTIKFINGNFLEHNFYDADIVYIAATCFTDATWESLINKLAGLKPGSRIIVTTKTINHENFENTYHGVELMSWGLCPVNIYKVKDLRAVNSNAIDSENPAI